MGCGGGLCGQRTDLGIGEWLESPNSGYGGNLERSEVLSGSTLKKESKQKTDVESLKDWSQGPRL